MQWIGGEGVQGRKAYGLRSPDAGQEVGEFLQGQVPLMQDMGG